MNLKVETNIIMFDMLQFSGNFHPMTCGGGGGPCSGRNLKARQVGDKEEIEAYCDNCDEHEPQMLPFRNSGDDYIYLLEKLFKLQRTGKINNILK